MRAVVVTRPGGPDVLEVQQRPVPTIHTQQVLVRLRATAVNRADILQRLGNYAPPPGVDPEVLGLEFAGDVVEVFDDADRGWLGARVFGIASGGTYAEFVAVNVGALMRIPSELSYEQAAAVAEAFITAHDALCTIAHVKPHDGVLINAAGSGVGLAAIQIARAIGAAVFATVRTQSKREHLRQFGAFVLTNHSEFADEVHSLRAGGVDVIVDFVGAAVAAENLRALAQRGRWVVVGLLGGATAEVDLRTLLRKRARLEGSVLRSRSDREKADATAAFEKFAAPLWTDKTLAPVIFETMPLAHAKQAHEVMQSNQNVGKIVLSI